MSKRATLKSDVQEWSLVKDTSGQADERTVKGSGKNLQTEVDAEGEHDVTWKNVHRMFNDRRRFDNRGLPSLKAWSVMEFLFRLQQQIQDSTKRPPDVGNVLYITYKSRNAHKSNSENSLSNSCPREIKERNASPSSENGTFAPSTVTEITEDDSQPLPSPTSVRYSRKRSKRYQEHSSRPEVYRSRAKSRHWNSSKRYRRAHSRSSVSSSADPASYEDSSVDQRSRRRERYDDSSSHTTTEETSASDMNDFTSRLMAFVRRGSKGRSTEEKGDYTRLPASSDEYMAGSVVREKRRADESRQREHKRLAELMHYEKNLEEERIKELDRRIEAFGRYREQMTEAEIKLEDDSRREAEEWANSMWSSGGPCLRCKEGQYKVFARSYAGFQDERKKLRSYVERELEESGGRASWREKQIPWGRRRCQRDEKVETLKEEPTPDSPPLDQEAAPSAAQDSSGPERQISEDGRRYSETERKISEDALRKRRLYRCLEYEMKRERFRKHQALSRCPAKRGPCVRYPREPSSPPPEPYESFDQESPQPDEIPFRGESRKECKPGLGRENGRYPEYQREPEVESPAGNSAEKPVKIYEKSTDSRVSPKAEMEPVISGKPPARPGERYFPRQPETTYPKPKDPIWAPEKQDVKRHDELRRKPDETSEHEVEKKEPDRRYPRQDPFQREPDRLQPHWEPRRSEPQREPDRSQPHREPRINEQAPKEPDRWHPHREPTILEPSSREPDKSQPHQEPRIQSPREPDRPHSPQESPKEPDRRQPHQEPRIQSPREPDRPHSPQDSPKEPDRRQPHQEPRSEEPSTKVEPQPEPRKYDKTYPPHAESDKMQPEKPRREPDRPFQEPWKQERWNPEPDKPQPPQEPRKQEPWKREPDKLQPPQEPRKQEPWNPEPDKPQPLQEPRKQEPWKREPDKPQPPQEPRKQEPWKREPDKPQSPHEPRKQEPSRREPDKAAPQQDPRKREPARTRPSQDSRKPVDPTSEPDRKDLKRKLEVKRQSESKKEVERREDPPTRESAGHPLEERAFPDRKSSKKKEAVLPATKAKESPSQPMAKREQATDASESSSEDKSEAKKSQKEAVKTKSEIRLVKVEGKVDSKETIPGNRSLIDIFRSPLQIVGMSIFDQLTKIREQNASLKFLNAQRRGFYEPPTPYPMYLRPEDLRWLKKLWRGSKEPEPTKKEEEKCEEEEEEEEEEASKTNKCITPPAASPPCPEYEPAKCLARHSPCHWLCGTCHEKKRKTESTPSPVCQECVSERKKGVVENIRELRFCCPALPLPLPSTIKCILVDPLEAMFWKQQSRRTGPPPCLCGQCRSSSMYPPLVRDWSRRAGQRPDVWAKTQLDRSPNYISARGDRFYHQRLYREKMSHNNILFGKREMSRKLSLVEMESFPTGFKQLDTSSEKETSHLPVSSTFKPDFPYNPRAFLLYKCDKNIGSIESNNIWGSTLVGRKFYYKSGSTDVEPRSRQIQEHASWTASESLRKVNETDTFKLAKPPSLYRSYESREHVNRGNHQTDYITGEWKRSEQLPNYKPCTCDICLSAVAPLPLDTRTQVYKRGNLPSSSQGIEYSPYSSSGQAIARPSMYHINRRLAPQRSCISPSQNNSYYRSQHEDLSRYGSTLAKDSLTSVPSINCIPGLNLNFDYQVTQRPPETGWTSSWKGLKPNLSTKTRVPGTSAYKSPVVKHVHGSGGKQTANSNFNSATRVDNNQTESGRAHLSAYIKVALSDIRNRPGTVMKNSTFSPSHTRATPNTHLKSKSQEFTASSRKIHRKSRSSSPGLRKDPNTFPSSRSSTEWPNIDRPWVPRSEPTIYNSSLQRNSQFWYPQARMFWNPPVSYSRPLNFSKA